MSKQSYNCPNKNTDGEETCLMISLNPQSGPDSLILIPKGPTVSMMARNNKTVNKNVKLLNEFFVE